MSVNITVNGEYIRYKKCDLLNDPEYSKKEAESNRRRMRLLQVRNASKDLAKQVRKNVEKEKEIQLKKIEEIKEQEIELWRKNALEQQKMDLISSVFQVGTAQHAAQQENTKRMQKNTNRETKPKTMPNKVRKTEKGHLRNSAIQTDIASACNPILTRRKIIPKSISKKMINTRKSECIHGKDISSLSISDFSLESDESSSDSPKISKFKNANISMVQKVQAETNPMQMAASTVESITRSKKDLQTQTNKLDEIDVCSTESNDSNIPQTSATAVRKRFTQISDFIQKNIVEDPSSEEKPGASGELEAQASHLKSKSVTKPTEVYISPKTKSQNSTALEEPTPIFETIPLKSSSSSQSTQSVNPKVQFYDYKNKFRKEYEQPAAMVKEHGQSIGQLEMNAMECAALNQRFQEERKDEIEKLKQNSTERCQKALEKEQIRRTCADLTSKLTAISKQRHILPTNKYQFSSACLQQVNDEKQTKLNTAIEALLKRPAILTCSAISKNSDQVLPTFNPISQSHMLNLGSLPTDEEINSLNSSDSYCSVLLGYVNGQSKQISEDIRKYNNQNGAADKEKANKLQDLLSRINRLRDDLTQELEKCMISKSTTSKDLVQNMADSLSELRKEREHILISSDPFDSISKRESDLKKKEAILERRLKEFYKAQRKAKERALAKNTKAESQKEALVNGIYGCGETRSGTQYVDQNQNDKNGIQERDLIDKFEKRGEENEKNENNAKKKYDNTINKKRGENEKYLEGKEEETDLHKMLVEDEEYLEVKADEEFIHRHKVLVDNKPLEILIRVDGNPKTRRTKKKTFKMPTKLSSIIQSPIMKRSHKKSIVRSQDSSSTSYRSLPQTMHNKVDKILERAPISPKSKKHSPPLNPLLAHYIQRLLGMSRASINTLGVTSSDIDTPTSSIINATANISVTNTDKLQSDRLKRVQKFIEDNYSFITDFEESLRQSNSPDSSLTAKEIIWKKSLKDQKIKEKASNTKMDEREGHTKPIIKTTLKKQSIQLNEEINLSTNSARLTKTCTQRIAALTEMIDKVRKEKQKILETTLSSVSETGRNSTEYLDLPNGINKNEEIISSISYSKNIPIDGDRIPNQLEKDKSIGLSRDSGISISRPITVQETHASSSEDVRLYNPQPESSAETRKPKPPLSIARYSPDLVEDIPHELSTIFEVETPATSRLNTSVQINNPEVVAVLPDNITYKKFPTFEEYIRLNHLDMTQFDPEFSLQFEKEFNEFINLAKDGKIAHYEQFTSFDKYVAKFGDDKEAAKELLESLKIANLSFKKFPDKHDYLNKLNISTSDLLDSQTLENIEECRTEIHNSSSSESLINVERELKLRNILTKSFYRNVPQDRSSLSVTIAAAQQETNLEYHRNMSNIQLLSPEQTSTTNNSDNIEDDLKRLGIIWPSAMKKKTIQTQALSSTTSSSVEPSTSRRKPIPQTVGNNNLKNSLTDDNFALQVQDNGHPLNLREFLSRELLKRTTTSSSTSYSDDSIASSILRSIIGSMRERQANHNELDRQKTSTPMATNSTSSGKAINKSYACVSSGQLFSGESQLSSVHLNNSSKYQDIKKKDDEE